MYISHYILKTTKLINYYQNYAYVINFYRMYQITLLRGNVYHCIYSNCSDGVSSLLLIAQIFSTMFTDLVTEFPCTKIFAFLVFLVFTDCSLHYLLMNITQVLKHGWSFFIFYFKDTTFQSSNVVNIQRCFSTWLGKIYFLLDDILCFSFSGETTETRYLSL